MNPMQLTDEPIVKRYRYLLRTAAPEQIEQAHAEAFGQLPPEQRRLVLERLSKDLPPREWANRDDPTSLALMATRDELRQPGALERAFGGAKPTGAINGLGGISTGSFLSIVAGVVVCSAVADTIFGRGGYGHGFADGSGASVFGQDPATTSDDGYDGDLGGDF